MDVLKNPDEDANTRVLTDSVVDEEEERHRRLLLENEELKGQVLEVKCSGQRNRFALPLMATLPFMATELDADKDLSMCLFFFMIFLALISDVYDYQTQPS